MRMVNEVKKIFITKKKRKKKKNSFFLQTCSRYGKLFIDPFVKVYDIRTYRQLSPIPFPAGAFMLKFHPKFSSTLLIASQTGQFQLSDIQADISKPSRYYQVFFLFIFFFLFFFLFLILCVWIGLECRLTRRN